MVYQILTGIDSVGIYRISGSTTSIQRFRTQFNIGGVRLTEFFFANMRRRIEPNIFFFNLLDEFSVSFADEHDVNVITGLLKLYLRELRDPLMTYELYDAFIESARENCSFLCVY